MILLSLLQANANEGTVGVITGSIVAGVIAASKLWDHAKGKRRDASARSAASEQSTELRGIRDTMTMRFDALDTRVGELKEDLGREIGEVKDRVDGIEKRERERLERAAVTPDRRSSR